VVDYYDVLEVARDADQEAIERAYREKVKEHHPDVSDHPKAGARFQAVVDAEAVLGDPAERARYDDLGHEAYVRVVGDADAVDPDATDGAGGAAGDASPAGASAGATSERASRAAESRRRRRRSAGFEGARGPSAGGDNPSRRSYSPWSDAEDDGETDGPFAEEAPFDDDDPFDDDPFDGGDPFDGAGPGGWATDRDPFAAGEASHAGGSAATRNGRGHGDGGNGGAGGIWASGGPHQRATPSPEATRERPPIAAKVRSQDVQLLSVALLFVYPGFVFFSVAPSMPLVANLVVGAATAAIVVVTFTERAIAFVVFGFWSLLAPLLLAFADVGLLSEVGLLVLGVTWGPLALAGLLEALVR